jgi:hypothetical protein
MCGGFTCSKNTLVGLNIVYVLVSFLLIGVAVHGKRPTTRNVNPETFFYYKPVIPIILFKLAHVVSAISVSECNRLRWTSAHNFKEFVMKKDNLPGTVTKCSTVSWDGQPYFGH